MATLTRASARPLARLAAAALVIVALSACRPMKAGEANLFVATNNLRQDHGIAALGQQDALVDRARELAAALAAQGSLSHSDPQTWGIRWSAVAENVGVSGSMDDIVNRLIASPEHRENMLSTKYTHQAVGTARGKDGRIYAVQLFWRG